MVSKKCQNIPYFLYYFNFISHFVGKDDEDEVYNIPNLHTEEQDEFEIPDGNFF